MPRTVAILPAAGFGTRMGGDSPKQFRLLDGVPVIVFTLRRLAACPSIDEFLICHPRRRSGGAGRAHGAKRSWASPCGCVRGGDTRQESVANALAVPPDADLVLVHDAVRPLVTREQVERVIAEAARAPRRHSGHSRAGHSEGSEARQPARRRGADHRDDSARTRGAGADAAGFDAALLREAFARAAADGVTASDEAGLVERLGHDVMWCSARSAI